MRLYVCMYVPTPYTEVLEGSLGFLMAKGCVISGRRKDRDWASAVRDLPLHRP